MKKVCFKCGQSKVLEDFYKHPGMADGRLNKCKECNKLDVRKSRIEKIDYYREYDRKRGNRQNQSYERDRRGENIRKYKAKTAVSYAKKKGWIFSKPCEICGEPKTHAHHDDYAFPLVVRWLCPAHHKQWHVENGEAPNGGPI